MGSLDKLFFWFFGILSVAGIVLVVVSLRKAFAAASRKDEELGMFFWSVGALVGLILTAGSLLYFLLPLILHYYVE